MRIWFDTEFIEDGKTIDLLSIGMVREDGFLLYMENSQCDVSRACPWVRKNVFPCLKGGAVADTPANIATAIKNFVGNHNPEFWAYYADYDWVALCQLYGRMVDLPDGWLKFCRDIRQLREFKGDPELPRQTSNKHNALSDALWNKTAWEFLTSIPSPTTDNAVNLLDYAEQIKRMKIAMSHAKKALRPFADRVFNDNGSMTIDMQPFETDQIIAAYFAIRELK